MGKKGNPNSRKDMTKWLIHFVKDVDHRHIPGKTDDEYAFFSKDELDDGTSAMDVLRNIIRVGGLLAKPSFRNGRTTLYGGENVVCATEMPLYSFYKYARLRSAAGNVSSIGVAFLKEQFFAEGGRHAIYGLSKPLKYIKNGNTKYYKILEESCLPKEEQYRYVHTQLNGTGWTDWTHEREWRWKKTMNHHSIWTENREAVQDCYDGLPLFKSDSKCKIDRIIFIVSNSMQADIIKKDLTGLYIAGHNNYGTPFSRDVIKHARIINMEEIVAKIEKDDVHEYETIEGIERKNLVRPLNLGTQPTPKQIERMKKAISQGKRKANAVKSCSTSPSAIGRCKVMSDDICNKWVQKFLFAKLAHGPFDGKVVFHFGIFGSQDLDLNEKRAEAFKQELEKTFGNIFYLDPQFD